MKLVILESPYSGNIEANVDYARRCVRDCLYRGESPIASHLLFTQENILNDAISAERKLGIKAGLAWIPQADYSVYYTDRGWSPGMLATLHEYSIQRGYPFRIRALFGTPTIPASLYEEVEVLLRKAIQP